MWMASYLFGALADYLISFKMSVGCVRKLMHAISQLGPALGFICLAIFVGCDRALAIIILSLSVGFNGASCVGFQVSH